MDLFGGAFVVLRDSPPCRDIVYIRCLDSRIDIGARGISYCDWGIKTLDHFVKDCTRMNLEWVV